MNRLTYTLALTGSVLALAGCPGDDTPSGDTEGGSGTTGDTGGMTSPTTSANTTTPMDDTADDTAGPTTMPATDDAGACDPPCEQGQECIAGQCFGDPETTGPQCDVWGMNGNYADCVMGETCNGGSCVSDNPAAPTAGACALLGCDDICDCPDPTGFEGGTLVCDTLTSDMQNGCYFDCSGGAACPTGMSCLGNFFCAWGGEAPAEPYGDCANGATCAEGICAVDDPMNVGAGACASPCMAAADCPAPPEGGAAPQCGEFGNMMSYCIIPCTGGCPDGMECVGNTLCLWPVMEAPVPGFGDCVEPAPSDNCLDSETCFTDNAGAPTHGFCTGDCTTVDDCADAPVTGDAPITCGDIGGGGDTCYLDCSGGETCPDNMACINDDYCAFEVLEPSFFEDFESGAIPATWTLINEDGLTVNPMNPLPFNDAAFIVVQDPEGSNAAVGTSYYMPAGTADDWLITPQLSLGAASVLGFEARSGDPGFLDDYEVLVSTGGATIAEFMMNAAVLDVTGEAATYTSHQVDLAAEGFASEDVYIAFHLTTNNGAVLFIDNVFVTD